MDGVLVHRRITPRTDVTKTGNGEWGMGNGKLKIENGKLIFFRMLLKRGMGNGKWEMGNGKWEMGN